MNKNDPLMVLVKSALEDGGGVDGRQMREIRGIAERERARRVEREGKMRLWRSVAALTAATVVAALIFRAVLKSVDAGGSCDMKSAICLLCAIDGVEDVFESGSDSEALLAWQEVPGMDVLKPAEDRGEECPSI
ncbi:MAG: hypothetical protein J6T01_01460 [Kiritimatiellae bacterium]|nr:hypothetical protein [Kiritimatiellia bacterium]